MNFSHFGIDLDYDRFQKHILWVVLPVFVEYN